jgi:glycosyltransferase involved in cell wall biosynthesis
LKDLAANPLVTVVLPTYNRAGPIGRAIASVLEQSYTNLEVIVVDDASSDSTAEVVGAFTDPRLRYLRHRENKGGAAARNTGIEAAGGELIAFQDSDDAWLPEKLAKQVPLFQRREVGVVYTGLWVLKDGDKTYFPANTVAKREGDIHSELLKGSFIGTPTLCVRKECFKKAGAFDERLPRLQDWELLIRLSKHYTFGLVDEPLVLAYLGKDNISANSKALLAAQTMILEKHYDDFMGAGQGVLGKHLYEVGHLLCLQGKASLGREYIGRALKHSARPKYLAGFLLSLLGSGAYKTSARLRARALGKR